MHFITRCKFFYGSSGYIPELATGDNEKEEDEDEDKESRTEIIRSVSEIGEMVDFLKAFPNITREEYIWGLSVPMIRIMGMDNSHVNYLSKKEIERRKGQVVDTKGKSASELNNDLGVKIQFPTE